MVGLRTGKVEQSNENLPKVNPIIRPVSLLLLLVPSSVVVSQNWPVLPFEHIHCPSMQVPLLEHN